MNTILGKWIQAEDQPYAGLWFEFNADGTFLAQYDAMAIVSSGTYKIEGDFITMNQTSHSFGLVGEFQGLFAVEGDTLTMSLASGAGQPRPANLSAARTYTKAQ